MPTATTALLLSRVQWAFTMSFHIIFPAFTIGLAAWLAFLEVFSLVTERPIYRKLFDFWLRIFAISFGMGVVSGIVMAFQFGTNWSVFASRAGGVQGVLLAYESFTAFALEAAFFAVLMFGRNHVPKSIYLISCLLVALGTNMSAFWILANNSWMQHPVGYTMGPHGVFVAHDWATILFNRVAILRFVHMALAAYITTAFCVAATGAWYALRASSGDRTQLARIEHELDEVIGAADRPRPRTHMPEARAMLYMGLRLAAVLVPMQLFAGHLVGGYVAKDQPSKISALEGRWHSQKPASEVLIGWPDPALKRNLFQISLPPPVGSLIDSESLTAREVGITDIPKDDRPPVLVVFFAFRIMVGLGILMLCLAWGGTWLSLKHRLERTRWFLWPVFLSFPAGFLAILAGWFTAEVGRQPWVIWGQLRTADAMTPNLTAAAVTFSLVMFVVIYTVIFGAGTYYTYRTLQKGPDAIKPIGASNAKRPLAVPGGSPQATSAAE